MIITVLITGLLELVKLIFSIMPDLPDISTTISDAGQWFIDQIVNVISLLRYLYGPTLLTAIVAVMVLLFSFEKIYRFVMWILRKIPMVNIK